MGLDVKNLDLHFEIRSDFSYLPFLTKIFKCLKIPKAGDLTHILVEAFTNAVIHGHRKEKRKWIGIALSLSHKRGRLRVLDQGGGIPKKAFQSKGGPWETKGRGLMIMQALADRVISKRIGKFHCLEAICSL